ncbi:MAG: hypothetical protein GKR89_17915 [Candidatus Latescibacteria bacterium]|nr:hypothetical protein [Candidatus Latescibacterota bacterium]
MLRPHHIPFALLWLALPLQAGPLLDQHYQAGVLDHQTALLYRAYAVAAPQHLPVIYRHDGSTHRCGTPALLAARDGLQDPRHTQALAKILDRPSLDFDYISPTGKFRIHYTLNGRNAVDPADADANGIPDYIDQVAATMDDVWRLQIDTLGYRPPPVDNGLGGGDEQDIYIKDLSVGTTVYGWAFPDGNGDVSSTYNELDNNYTDSGYIQTRGLDAMRVTAAHEFFHAIQFGYYQGRDGIWWQEASATWMEEVAYPEIDDYLQYLSAVLSTPENALNGFSSGLFIYGASIFAHFLDQRFERDLIRAIWEEMGDSRSAGLENFDRPIRRLNPGGLALAASEYGVWNYFTGSRHVPDRFYAEGDKYPLARTRPIETPANSPVERRSNVDRLGSTYLTFDPALRPGGLVLDLELEGQARSQLLLRSGDQVEIRPFDGPPHRLPAWDQYDQVVLVLTSTNQNDFGFDYALTAQYDPNLDDADRPVSFQLAQSYPNPFSPENHGHTRLRYELAAPSSITDLSIVAADGRLVRRYELGAQAARIHFHDWDGRNQAGDLVGSGIYHYILAADGAQSIRSLAVVRD